MSYIESQLNDDQRDHLRYLRSQPLDRLTWCGWGTIGDGPGTGCGHPECDGRGTRADYLAAACPWCRVLPLPGCQPHHQIGCPWEFATSPFSDLSWTAAHPRPHEWRDMPWATYDACRHCGAVKRADGHNGACPGPVKVVPRVG